MPWVGRSERFFYVEVTYTEDLDVFVLLNPKPGNPLVTLDEVHSFLKSQGAYVDRDGYFNHRRVESPIRTSRGITPDRGVWTRVWNETILGLQFTCFRRNI